MHESTGTVGVAAGRITRACIALATAGAALLASPAAISQDLPAGNLAAAVRESGHACTHVIEAQQTSSSPATYRVRCNSGTFTITMKADGSFEVTPAD